MVQKIDVLDAVLALGVDDFGFAREEAIVGIERNQICIRAVGDVLDESARQLQQR